MEKNIRERENNFARKKAAALRKRRRRKTVIVVLISLITIFSLILGVLSGTLFFRVGEIKITGQSLKYTKDEIVSATGIKLDDNLLFLSSKDAANSITEKLPYIKTVKIKKEFPETVIINFTETKNELCVLVGGKYYAADKEGKILATFEERQEDLPLIELPDDCTVSQGENLKTNNASVYDIFSKYTELMDIYDFKINAINLKNPYDSYMMVENRLKVRIGSTNNFDMKVAHFNTMLSSMPDGATGTVDLSNWTPKKQEAFFTSSEL